MSYVSFVPVFGKSADAAWRIGVESVSLNHDSDSVQLVMTVRMPDDLSKRDVVVMEPMLVGEVANGSRGTVPRRDSVSFPSVGVYGRWHYYAFVRDALMLFQDSTDQMFTWKEARRQPVLRYACKVARKDWMEGADLRFRYTRYTCCGNILDRGAWEHEELHMTLPGDTIVKYTPVVRELKGVMHVDFVLDSVNIRPDYHDNHRELAKLDRDLQTLLADTNVTIRRVTLHGYASPEGSYGHNDWLARNRTEALKRYVRERHPRLDSTLIEIRSTAEDWAGLRAFMDTSAVAASMKNRDAVRAIIDDTLGIPDPDERLRMVRRRYKQEFALILQHCLPFLRHTDYTILHSANEWRRSMRVIPPRPVESAPMQPDMMPHMMTSMRPLFAVKTNLLLDLAAWPNVEVEVPVGRRAKWSVMAEWGSPWYVWHHNSRAYEILNVGVEVRRWMRRCDDCRPALTGAFLGAYVAGGKYDIEWNSKGDQGEYCSVGLSGGYSWILGKCWNLELSGSVGVLFGPKRHYHGEFNDTHLIWKYNDNLFYAGPTQVKLSIVWLIPRKWFGMKE